jgi:hypothetical protein
LARDASGLSFWAATGLLSHVQQGEGALLFPDVVKDRPSSPFVPAMFRFPLFVTDLPPALVVLEESSRVWPATELGGDTSPSNLESPTVAIQYSALVVVLQGEEQRGETCRDDSPSVSEE